MRLHRTIKDIERNLRETMYPRQNDENGVRGKIPKFGFVRFSLLRAVPTLRFLCFPSELALRDGAFTSYTYIVQFALNSPVFYPDLCFQFFSIHRSVLVLCQLFFFSFLFFFLTRSLARTFIAFLNVISAYFCYSISFHSRIVLQTCQNSSIYNFASLRNLM